MRRGAAITIVLLAMSACSSPAGRVAAVQRELVQAVRATRSTGNTARFHMSRQLGPPERRSPAGTADGVIDFVSGNQQYTLAVPGQIVEIRIIGDVQYSMSTGTQVPADSRDRWIASALPTGYAAQITGFLGISLFFLELGQGFVDAHKGEGGLVGRVPTDRYEVQVEPIYNVAEYRSATQRLSSNQRSRIERSTSGRYEVWVDKERLIRRLRLVVDNPTRSVEGLDIVPGVSTIDFSEFGTPVAIAAPPPG